MNTIEDLTLDITQTVDIKADIGATSIAACCTSLVKALPI